MGNVKMPFKKHNCQLGLGSESMLPKKIGTWSNICRTMTKLTQVTQYHPDTYDHFRSYPEIVAERQRQLYEGGGYLIHPFSLASLSWNSLMAFVNLAHMFISPLRLFYVVESVYMHSPHPIDYALLLLNIVCFLDIIMQFNIGFQEKNCVMTVLDKQLIACRYFQRLFLFDLISCLPVAFILLSAQLDNARYILIAHIMPLLRTPRIYSCIVDLKIFMKIFTRSYIWYGAVRHTVLFIITTHWCSCLIYLPAIVSYYWHGRIPLNYNRFLRFAGKSGNLLEFNMHDRYRKAMFISISAFFGTGFSMFHASEPDEIVIHAMIILYSSLFMVYTLVFLLKIYMTINSTTVRYHELMNQVEEYMTYKQFPSSLKRRVRAFYSYKYMERYYREEAALDCLSEELRDEIALHTRHKLIYKVVVFEGVPASVVGTLLGCLRPEVFLPNDPVVRAGDLGDCMYFIASGTVAVYSLKGVEVCHLEDGAHFGEVALLMRDSKRVATVVAVEITQVYRLDAEDFKQYILTNQMLYERIETLASKRMHETVLLDEAFRKDIGRRNESQEIPKETEGNIGAYAHN